MSATLPISRETWVFPVPDLGDRRPEISDGWASRRYQGDEKVLHIGADIMFRRSKRGELADVYPPGTPHGSPNYFMPDNVPALAASAGVVVFAARTRQGYTVKIRHPEGWTTYYTHLSLLSVTRGQTVVAGQSIGVIGFDPTSKHKLMHLHFELWRGDKRSGATNPGPYLAAWERRALPGIPAQIRNGGLTYRPIGAVGAYPTWIRELKGASGVYVIRERRAGKRPIVVYVGQSNTDRLYHTLTRHFATWRRRKRWWTGGYTEGHDPGLVYDRALVEVAVRVTSPDDALDEEARLITRLRPRDNLIGQPEEVPF